MELWPRSSRWLGVCMEDVRVFCLIDRLDFEHLIFVHRPQRGPFIARGLNDIWKCTDILNMFMNYMITFGNEWNIFTSLLQPPKTIKPHWRLLKRHERLKKPLKFHLPPDGSTTIEAKIRLEIFLTWPSGKLLVTNA